MMIPYPTTGTGQVPEGGEQMQLLHVEKVYLSDGSVIEDCDCATHDSGFLILDNPDNDFDWYSIGQSVLKLEGVTVRKQGRQNISYGNGRIG